MISLADFENANEEDRFCLLYWLSKGYRTDIKPWDLIKQPSEEVWPIVIACCYDQEETLEHVLNAIPIDLITNIDRTTFKYVIQLLYLVSRIRFDWIYDFLARQPENKTMICQMLYYLYPSGERKLINDAGISSNFSRIEYEPHHLFTGFVYSLHMHVHYSLQMLDKFQPYFDDNIELWGMLLLSKTSVEQDVFTKIIKQMKSPIFQIYTCRSFSEFCMEEPETLSDFYAMAQVRKAEEIAHYVLRYADTRSLYPMVRRVVELMPLDHWLRNWPWVKACFRFPENRNSILDCIAVLRYYSKEREEEINKFQSIISE